MTFYLLKRTQEKSYKIKLESEFSLNMAGTGDGGGGPTEREDHKPSSGQLGSQI